MLKIKDNIDLNELKKFGFVKVEEGMTTFDSCVEWWLTFNADEYDCLTVFEDRTLYIGSDVTGDSHIFNILYDLIKADLVEKRVD